MAKKGIHLYSGGLDSVLSAKLLLDQGIDLIGLHFILPFFPSDSDPEQSAPAKRARDIGLKLRFVRCGMDYMAMAQNPPHGFGSEMNPCIDCKIFFLKYAADLMHAEDAAFVSTGEVVGQRPMSQMKAMMRHIMKETSLDGRLLRPLSALLLPPTIAENEGIVDRSKLLNFSGRGRTQQKELAAKWGIVDFATPAGGCLFTDPNVARRIKDLYAHHPKYNLNDMYLLSLGRHFRMEGGVKLIVARNEPETIELEKYAGEADLFLSPDFPAPCIFVRGIATIDMVPFLVSVMVRYGKLGKSGSPQVNVSRKGKLLMTVDAGDAVSDETLEPMRI
ncbi:MAG TPA: tRNA 4-thiouridine(8) synthase ThiI [Spirochaetota bacterium]